jgi:hypothetical protein
MTVFSFSLFLLKKFLYNSKIFLKKEKGFLQQKFIKKRHRNFRYYPLLYPRKTSVASPADRRSLWRIPGACPSRTSPLSHGYPLV